MDQYFDKVFPLGFEIMSSGLGDALVTHGDVMGRFEPLIGEEENGVPVYKQAHSREIPNNRNYLLYR